MAGVWWLQKSRIKTTVICTVITARNSFLRMSLLIIACRLWHQLFCAGNKWWAISYQHSKTDEFKDRTPVKHISEIPSISLPPLAADASFSKFSSCKVSTLPLLPDCYHNSFALYHQNISSCLHSKKIAISSVPLAILHWKGREKCSAFLVCNVVSLQGNHLLIHYYHLSIAFCQLRFILAKFSTSFYLL